MNQEDYYRNYNAQRNNKNYRNFNHGKKNRNYNKNRNDSGGFPYKFVSRKETSKNKYITHAKLEQDRFDISFELELTTKTPIGVNPCEITEGKCPKYNGEDIGGYYKRWLMINNKLSISSFTIKGMIEAAYANFFGGCYRVNDSKISAHPKEHKEGDYPYNGAYKRYRVDRASSFPGIIKNITNNEDGSKKITIQPVEEFYYDKTNLPSKIKKGDEIVIKYIENRYKKTIISFPNKIDLSNKNITKAIYYAPYEFGMNLTLQGGDLGKNHYHRFYKNKKEEFTVTIPSLYFEPLKALKEKVYMGIFKITNYTKKLDKRKYCVNEPWYDDLSDLKIGDWIYYNKIGDNVVGIGKNYLFKAIFNHRDTVPKEFQQCSNMEELCPRCSLFGFTANENQKVIAYKGRVYTSNFINNISLKKESIKEKFEFINGSVEIFRWIDKEDNTEIARQFLLPILGAPKPNKRDVRGYYNRNGLIKGAKIYKNIEISFQNLKNVIKQNIKDTKKWQKEILKEENYSHKLRNFAQICKEGLKFKGTIGIENASAEEIAQMFILLNNNNIFYKIGIAKSLGLGSVSLRVTKIWIRNAQNYETWHKIEKVDFNCLNSHISNFYQLLDNVKGSIKEKVEKYYNNIDDKKLQYPAPKNYWKNARF